MDKEQSAFFRKFGSAVRKLRLSREVTLEDMQAHGFSPQHFQKIESGKKAINLYTAYRIAKAFRIHFSNLLDAVE